MADLASLDRQLARAEQRVEDGAQRIARQQSVLAQLKREGHNTESGNVLLAALQQNQQLQISLRDLLLTERARSVQVVGD